MGEKDIARQIAAAAAGAALAYYGFKRGGAGGAIMGLMGAGLATSNLRSVTGLAPGPGGEARYAIEVEASPKEAFEIWSRFENIPRFMQNIIQVRRTGERTWRWAARAPFGQRIEWDVDIVEVRPDKLIAWRSTSADVPGGGEVWFEPTPKGARVMVLIEYSRITGPISELMSAVTGKSPKAMLREDLRRFKRLIEQYPQSQNPPLEGYAHA